MRFFLAFLESQRENTVLCPPVQIFTTQALLSSFKDSLFLFPAVSGLSLVSQSFSRFRAGFACVPFGA